MKYYLSSYKFGNEVDKLKEMLPQGAVIGHINNSKDTLALNQEIRDNQLKIQMDFLDSLGFRNEHLDLNNYFGKEADLRKKLEELDGVWVSGGNTFVLRQAMKLSGFDQIYKDDLKNRKDYFWGGYSAGVCILCDSLKYISNVDNPDDFPYERFNETIWDGLALFNYGILPHYNSTHHESEEVEKEVQRCIENRWLFKVMKDGEVIIIEK